MKNLIVILVIIHFSLFTIHSFAQSCLPEGITFTMQAQIDSFQIIYPGCTEIVGEVTISGNNITNLNGLSVLTSIRGDLRISSNVALTSLAGLENLLTVWDDFTIQGNDALTSLTGLEHLVSTVGDFSIKNNGALTNLEGLGSLYYSGGNLEIIGNGSLYNLAGLGHLNLIGGDFLINSNESLESLEELNWLHTIGGNFSVSDNESLASLEGINWLETIGGNLRIGIGEAYDDSNPSLVSLEALNSLTSVGGEIYIENNNMLPELTGLDNIEAGSIKGLTIAYNSSLSYCEVLSVCDYLANPGGNIEIHHNAAGCLYPEEIEEACLCSCLPGGITFTTQAQIDSFQVNYPICKKIEGNVGIGDWQGTDINNLDALIGLSYIRGRLDINYTDLLTDLSGLDSLTKIGGDLDLYENESLINLSGLNNLSSVNGGIHIERNEALESFTGLNNVIYIENELQICGNSSLQNFSGLENLSSIRGDFIISSNDKLVSLSGLEKLESIGGYLIIGSWAQDAIPDAVIECYGNPVLTDLSALNNLTSVGGSLGIFCNDSLDNLTGLENLNASSIESLSILYNHSLTTCEAESICAYLDLSNAVVDIHDNATGCNSEEEVVEACHFGVDQLDGWTVGQLDIKVFPNPAYGIVNCQFGIVDCRRVSLKIYDLYGREVATVVDEVMPPGEHYLQFDTSGLPAGIYLYRLKSVGQLDNWTVGKLVVVR